jgi:hypothetical protein
MGRVQLASRRQQSTQGKGDQYRIIVLSFQNQTLAYKTISGLASQERSTATAKGSRRLLRHY